MHHERRALPVRRSQGLHQVNQPVLRIGSRKTVRRSRRYILQRPKRPHIIDLIRHWALQEPLGLINPRAIHKGRPLGLRKLHRDLAGEPALHIELRIIKHRLGRSRIGEQFPRWRHDLMEAGCPRLPASPRLAGRSEEHTSELQSLMRNSYAVFCLKKKKTETKEKKT